MYTLLGDKKDALKTGDFYGKNMDRKEINWRGWSNDLRQYLDKLWPKKAY